MTRVFAKPGEGRKVKLPGGKLVTAGGEWLDRSLFVDRRLADGDLVETSPSGADPFKVGDFVPQPPEAPEPGPQPEPEPTLEHAATVNEHES
jgi:hypothetical protein